jgi:hypothetical protein
MRDAENQLAGRGTCGLSGRHSMGSWGLKPARARDASETGRTAVPLELFFDLVFVVAV